MRQQLIHLLMMFGRFLDVENLILIPLVLVWVSVAGFSHPGPRSRQEPAPPCRAAEGSRTKKKKAVFFFLKKSLVFEQPLLALIFHIFL